MMTFGTHRRPTPRLSVNLSYQNEIRNTKVCMLILFTYNQLCGVKGDWDFRISALVKNPDELIFNPCYEFRCCPQGPVSQIHSPHLHVGAPEIFSDLLRSVQMLKREWGAGSKLI